MSNAEDVTSIDALATGGRADDLYRIAPDLALESFGDKALLLLAQHDIFITVNKSAADLLILMMDTFGTRPFQAAEFVGILEAHYDLTGPQAEMRADRVLRSWSGHGIIIHETLT